MAVRPTDDRSVDQLPLDPAAPTTLATPSWLYYLSAALAAVVVVCVGVLGFLLVHDTGNNATVGDRVTSLFGGRDNSAAGAQAADLTTERNAAMAVADQFILRINTYGPHDLDAHNQLPGYVQRVDAVISAKLRAGFEQSVKLAEQTVAQTGYARNTQLFATGVSSIDSDTATVLVAGSFTSSYPNKNHPLDPSKRISFEAVPFRYQIPMVKIDGSWKVDDFIAVTDGTGTGTSPLPNFQGQQPIPSPTGQPTRKPTQQPTQQPTQKATKGAGR